MDVLMGIGLVPDDSQPPGATPSPFARIGSNFPFFYNGTPVTADGFVQHYNHQRGTPPNHLGWRTQPLNLVPLTGIGVTDAQLGYQADRQEQRVTAEQMAQSYATRAAYLIRIGRRLHNFRELGIRIPEADLSLYTNEKLRLANDLSQICRARAGVRIPMPKELNLTVRDAAGQSCITPQDIPVRVVEERVAGLGALPALLAIPGVIPLVKFIVVGVIAAIVTAPITLATWTASQKSAADTAALDKRQQACEGRPPEDAERCLAAAQADFRKDAEAGGGGKDPLSKFGDYLKWGAVIVGIALLGPPILQAITKATSKATT